MRIGWAARFPRGSALAVMPLRDRADVAIKDAGDWLWVKGETITDEITQQLLRVPGLARFEMDEEGRLWPWDSRIPRGKLDEQGWVPLGSFFEIKMPTAALPGEFRERVGLRIVRSDVEQPAGMLITDLKTWESYATKAPLIRLRQLQFAVAADWRVLVRGSPLPSIPGIRLTDHDGVAVPSGWRWEPAVPARSLRMLLGIHARDVAVFDTNGTWELLRDEDFVAATRSAVRLTATREA